MCCAWYSYASDRDCFLLVCVILYTLLFICSRNMFRCPPSFLEIWPCTSLRSRGYLGSHWWNVETIRKSTKKKHATIVLRMTSLRIGKSKVCAKFFRLPGASQLKQGKKNTTLKTINQHNVFIHTPLQALTPIPLRGLAQITPWKSTLYFVLPEAKHDPYPI